MSHKNVLKRAWEILWQYKALWVFGLILALTTASYSPQSNYQFNRSDFQPDGTTFQIEPGQTFWGQMGQAFTQAWHEMQRLFENEFSPSDRQLVINTLIALACFIFIWAIVATIFRYVSETAMIQMVDEHEELSTRYHR